MPELKFLAWPDEIADPAAVDHALVWLPPRGALGRFPGLKAVFSLGAGVDRLLGEADLPAGVPVVRLVDPALTELMVEYVVHWVIHHHRGFGRYAAGAQEPAWERRWPGQASDTRVGILGLGELGGAAARALAGLGFDTAGWSHTARDVPGVRGLHGPGGLDDLLARSDILVCLLPLTPETADILDARALAILPPGAVVINAARGEHVVERDLLAALDSGRLSAAVLDVFRTEPLPSDHPFWSHPRVTVTPHVASLTNGHTATRAIADDIRRVEAGEPPLHPVDRARGY